VTPEGYQINLESAGQSLQKSLRLNLAPFDKIIMMNSWLTLSNRQENLKLLMDYVRKWSKEHSLLPKRQQSLEKAAQQIFSHLVNHVYRPDQPGSIAVSLEEKGPRLRLTFEDDAAPHNPSSLSGLPAPGNPDPVSCVLYNGLQQLAESVVYYRTADRKNRMVIFLT
jgi:anti-sigma regulatory factor (Ser/Thr protein kinase)